MNRPFCRCGRQALELDREACYLPVEGGQEEPKLITIVRYYCKWKGCARVFSRWESK